MRVETRTRGTEIRGGTYLHSACCLLSCDATNHLGTWLIGKPTLLHVASWVSRTMRPQKPLFCIIIQPWVSCYSHTEQTNTTPSLEFSQKGDKVIRRVLSCRSPSRMVGWSLAIRQQGPRASSHLVLRVSDSRREGSSFTWMMVSSTSDIWALLVRFVLKWQKHAILYLG